LNNDEVDLHSDLHSVLCSGDETERDSIDSSICACEFYMRNERDRLSDRGTSGLSQGHGRGRLARTMIQFIDGKKTMKETEESHREDGEED
jgi:hypothetical protein